MKTLLTFVWLLPQNIIGLAVLIFTKIQGAKSERYNGTLVTRWKYGSGVSLGQFIFVSEYAPDKTIKHEYGHYRQGLMLGWLYLFVVGIPSICWAAFGGKYRQKHRVSYYSRFPENWADKLGGVER